MHVSSYELLCFRSLQLQEEEPNQLPVFLWYSAPHQFGAGWISPYLNKQSRPLFIAIRTGHRTISICWCSSICSYIICLAGQVDRAFVVRDNIIINIISVRVEHVMDNARVWEATGRFGVSNALAPRASAAYCAATRYFARQTLRYCRFVASCALYIHSSLFIDIVTCRVFTSCALS